MKSWGIKIVMGYQDPRRRRRRAKNAIPIRAT
jgi:hypothetical protein